MWFLSDWGLAPDPCCYTGRVTNLALRGPIPVLIAAALLSACAGSGTGATTATSSAATSPVMAPAADEPASDVVSSYLKAVTAGDTAAATAVSTAGFASHDPWQQGQRASLEDVKVSSTAAKYDTTWSDDTLKAYSQVVSVSATFDVAESTQGFSAGAGGTTFLLARNSDTQPWLIASMGEG